MSKTLRSSGFACVLAAAALISGCSDRTGSTPAYYPAATPTPAGLATPAAFSATQTASTTVGTPVTIAPAGSGGFTAGATLADPSTAVTVTDTVSSSAPNGVTAFAVTRAALAQRTTSAAAAATIIDYLTISANGPVTFDGAATLTFTLPSAPSGFSFYVDEYVGTGWSTFAGPAAISGSTLTFTVPDTALVLTATTSQSFVLYALPAGSAAPATPVAVAPAILTFATSGSAAASFAASEGTDTGSFTATSSATDIATVTASSSGTFTVTPVGAGTTSIIVTGPDGNAAIEAVTVTGVPVTVSSHARIR